MEETKGYVLKYASERLRDDYEVVHMLRASDMDTL